MGIDELDAVIGQEFFVKGPVDRYGDVVCGSVFDLLTIDVDVHQPVAPIDVLDRPWRDQHLFAGPPVLGIDDEVTNAPIGSSIRKFSTWPISPSLAWM